MLALRSICIIASFLLVGRQAFAVELVSRSSVEFSWKTLAPLPDREGFAGAFAGVSGGSLVVAGGANFPDRKPWEGGAKVWSDTVFALESPGATWRIVGKLPRPLAYGVSVTIPAGVVCAGGSDAQHHYADVFLMNWDGGRLQFTSLPDLPEPCANFSGALVGNTLYVAGGLARPGSTTALKVFWSLDLDAPQARWRKLDPWPGPERMFAVVAAHEGCFFLFSGAALKPATDGKPMREWLRDAYRYTPGAGWKRLADLPRAVVAAPSPAVAADGRLLVLGGDDGSQVATPPSAHKGFPRDVLAYDPKTDRWERMDESPFGLVTTPTVQWDQLLVVPSGEMRPGIRSTEVWAATVR
jgi:N-acetylneuraminate epimerase